MQATVSSFDDSTRSGTVLLDDGVEIPFSGDTVAEQLRFLRPGQRVRLETAGKGRDLRILRVQIITLSG